MGHQISRHQIVQYSKVLKSGDGEVIRAQGNGRYYDGQATGGGQVSKAQGVDITMGKPMKMVKLPEPK